MPSVYLIVHVPTGRGYVGRCVSAPEKRWATHWCEVKTGRTTFPLHAAMRAFPKEEFSLRTLDTGLTRQEAIDREFQWTLALGTLAPRGFNMRLGTKAPAKAWNEMLWDALVVG